MKRKVIITSIIICIIFAVFGVASLFVVRELRLSIAQMQADNEEIRLFGEFDTNLVLAAGESATFVNMRNEAYATKTNAALERARQAHQQLTELINSSDTDMGEQTDHLHEHRALVLNQLEQNITEVQHIIRTTQPDLSANQGLLDMIYLYEPGAVHMREEMQKYLIAEQNFHRDAVNESLRLLIAVRIFFLVIFLGLLIGFFLFMRNVIVNPLNQLSDAASRIASGDLESSVPDQGRDEVGVLQRSFNKMIRDLREAFQQRDLALEQSLLDKNAAEAANRAKSTFLANMSHELRTPLTAISGWATILQDARSGSLNDDQSYGLQVIEHSSQHLLSLINDILDLSKIEAGKMELDLSSVQLEPLCRESIESVISMAKRKQIDLNCTIDSALDHIQADQRALKQMLVNLLSNAVKFTGQGGNVGLEVQTDPTKNHILFRVWDTGIGIAPEDIALLFQPFVQIDSSLTRREQGTGLGLVLTHRLTVLHGGDIRVESTLGKGSSFTISLPEEALYQAPAVNGVE